MLPTGEPVFSRTEALWAKGSTVHVGEQSHDIRGIRVLELDWSRHGLFLGVAPRHSNALEPTTTRFYDGTKLHELSGVVEHVEVSPSGRTAAWID